MSVKTYEELRKINVNEHIEKKNNLSYLSWAWAVDMLFQNDPEASWEYREFDGKPYMTIGLPDGLGPLSFMVICTVKAFGRSRTAQLPIMDYKNKAMPIFTAFDLNTTMQRCLAKAISLHGIGLYIYAGEDLPDGEEPSQPKKAFSGPHKPTDGAWESMDADMKIFLTDLSGESRGLMLKGDFRGAAEHIHEKELDNEQKTALWTLFDSKERNALKKAFEEIRLKETA